MNVSDNITTLIDFVDRRVQTITEQGCTPFRVELGKELYENCGRPIEVLGLPVVKVREVSIYARVAYKEWTLELPPLIKEHPDTGLLM